MVGKHWACNELGGTFFIKFGRMTVQCIELFNIAGILLVKTPSHVCKFLS